MRLGTVCLHHYLPCGIILSNADLKLTNEHINSSMPTCYADVTPTHSQMALNLAFSVM